MLPASAYVFLGCTDCCRFYCKQDTLPEPELDPGYGIEKCGHWDCARFSFLYCSAHTGVCCQNDPTKLRSTWAAAWGQDQHCHRLSSGCPAPRCSACRAWPRSALYSPTLISMPLQQRAKVSERVKIAQGIDKNVKETDILLLVLIGIMP